MVGKLVHQGPMIGRGGPFAGGANPLTSRERLMMSLARDHGELTRAALIRLSGLSGTAVFRATEDLARRGLVLLGDPRPEGRGQPSHTVSIGARAAFSLGLAVMTDVAEFVAMDLSGVIIAQREIATEQLGREDVLEQLIAFAEHAERAGDLELGRIGSLGVAIAGYFVGEGSRVNPASELDDWAMIDLERLIGDRVGLPVIVENIASASAVGEHLLGVGRSFATFAYVNVASGFGGGIICNGSLWRGTHGNAGEFATLLRLAGRTTPNIESLRACLAEHGVVTANARDLLARFDPAWPGLDAWVQTAGASFGSLAAMIHATVDVEAVVLGGRLPASLAQRLAERAEVALDTEFRFVRRGRSAPLPRIVPASVASISAAVGAAAMPLARDYFNHGLPVLRE